MTRGMTGLRLAAGRCSAWLIGMVLCLSGPGHAVPLDERSETNLALRAYNAVRIGTERIGDEDNPLNWPGSPPGHVRQHRYFLQLDFDHDLRRLARTGWGLAAAFRWLDPEVLKYSVVYRGEGEGIYDYGPGEYQHTYRRSQAFRADQPVVVLGDQVLASNELKPEYIRRRVDKLRRYSRQRHRLFLAYLDVEKGPVFLRVGRQILAWGETDVFRLLDNINPVDDSFGSFFIPLDERRVPLDMVRASWNFGSFWKFSDMFLEGFAANGDTVAQDPGTPAGSPWLPGGLGSPNQSIRQVLQRPDKTAVRGGARLVFTAYDVTTTLAHYYTYFDYPGVRYRLPGLGPAGSTLPTVLPQFGNEILAFLEHPRVPVTGASVTFPIPSLYTIVRSEAAWFRGEPMNRQGRGNAENNVFQLGTPQARSLRPNTEGGLDPFVYPGLGDITGTAVFNDPNGRRRPLWGRVLQRDTFNLALGLDINRFIRVLNPQQTFFISTQFFYKHVFDSPGDLILPTPYRNIPVNANFPVAGRVGNPILGALGIAQGCSTGRRDANGNPIRRNCRLRPRFYHLDDDRFLHTLLITTSYSGGRIVPSYGMFYDWQGGLVFQPGVTFVRDPFRFVFDYTRVEAAPTGQFGTVRDRDNVRFQVEFVF